MDGFRFYYDKDLEFLFNEEKKNHHIYHAMKYAKKRLRMYANLYNRDMRKLLINSDSICEKCGSKKRITIDHIIPISKGGKNEFLNLQLLCNLCNNSKRDKLI